MKKAKGIDATKQAAQYLVEKVKSDPLLEPRGFGRGIGIQFGLIKLHSVEIITDITLRGWCLAAMKVLKEKKAFNYKFVIKYLHKMDVQRLPAEYRDALGKFLAEAAK